MREREREREFLKVSQIQYNMINYIAVVPQSSTTVVDEEATFRRLSWGLHEIRVIHRECIPTNRRLSTLYCVHIAAQSVLHCVHMHVHVTRICIAFHTYTKHFC